MSWILTASGKHLDLWNPQSGDICIDDIAHALANCCRFAGHTRKFYSVAQHSIMCSWLAAPEVKLEALLHDAAEAYLGDITRPLKPLLGELFDPIEIGLEARIVEKFRLHTLHDPKITRVDLIMLATERRDLMPPDATPWACLQGVEPIDVLLEPWPPEIAKRVFLMRFHELTDMRARGALP